MNGCCDDVDVDVDFDDDDNVDDDYDFLLYCCFFHFIFHSQILKYMMDEQTTNFFL